MIVPDLQIGMHVPDDLISLATAKRRWAKAGKDAMREILHDYWAEVIPRHFEPQAKTTYGYAPRKPSYVRFKTRVLHRPNVDLKKSGELEHSITSSYRGPRFSGAFGSGGGEFSGTITMKMPFPVSTKSTAAQVTAAQMAVEITTITPQESYKLSVKFRLLVLGYLQDARRTVRRR